MRNPFRNDLVEALRTNRVLVVVGAGVSLGASGGNPVASWPGLLESGVSYCEAAGVKSAWAKRRRDEIETEEVHELIGAAGHISLELRKRDVYGNWLRDAVRSLELEDPSVLDALDRLGMPIATTNYDNLIEEALGLDRATLLNRERYLEVAQGKADGVLHLHGHYLESESVVLGVNDYEGIRANEPAQAVQQALTVMRSLMLVGFGGGLDDPNFEALRTWMGKVLKGSLHQHYRLCLDSELEELQDQHLGEKIVPIAYGPTHQQLAPFLNALSDELGRPVKAPPQRRSTPVREPPAGGSSEDDQPAGRSAVAAPPARPESRVERRHRPAPGRVRLLVAVAVAAAVAVVGWLVYDAVRSGQGPLAASCPVPLELIVLTTPTKEASLRQAAVDFGGQKPGECRRSSVTVFSMASSSAMAGALAAGWPSDDLRFGPQPAVWLPDATAEVERVNRQAGDDLESLGSISTSPVVLAVPRSALAGVGEARTVAWRTMVGWTRGAASGSRLRIGRPDPASSTAGLLATIGLHGTVGGSATPGARRAVEQTIDPVADELTELCQLGQPGGPARAVIVPEQAMVAYNRGARLGGSCGTASQSQGSDRLVAVYAADGTPVLDHPFVLLPAAAELDDRERLARDFFAYLMSGPAQKKLREAGFRDAGRRVGGTVGEEDGVLVHDPPTWARPPDGATLVRELAAWQRVRRPARALLAMDVSGSMAYELPGPGGQRITAAREAAARAVGLMGNRDEIGLWRFSQSLDGPHDYEELVPLGPAGARAGGGRGSEQVISTLDGLDATPRDTGLYDTMFAGIGTLRSGRDAETVDALVVVTDGQNDDPNGGVDPDAVLRKLQEGDEVLVFLITFGPARCNTGELGELTRQPELVRCLDADRIGLERAFEQVTATLWGTGRLAARGGG